MRSLPLLSTLLIATIVSTGWYYLDHDSPYALEALLFTIAAVLLAVCVALLTGSEDA